MRLNLNLKGLDAAMKKLERLEQNARSVSGRHQVPVGQLFTADFMRRYTRVSSFEGLIAAGGHKAATEAEFRAIPDDEWEQTVRTHSSFRSWRAMQEKAAQDYVARRLNAGL